MNITKITIENFKTFKKLEFDVNEKFNMIVGENNIGKTTIFDALLLFKMAYNELINSSGNGFLKKINNNAKIIPFNKLVIFRIINTIDLFNDVTKPASIALDIKTSDANFKLKIEIETPNFEDSYIRIKNNDTHSDFVNFADYCKENGYRLKNILSVNFTKPIANILKDEPFCNLAQLQKKTYMGNSFEVLRNKILSTMKDDKFEYLEEKLKEVTDNTYKIRYKNRNRDDDECVKITLQKEEEKETDLSLVGSGILHIIEIFASLYVKEKNEDLLNILLIDEPDSHMHAKVQIKLIEELKKDDNRQIFLITHNDKLINVTEEGELFYLSSRIKDDGQLKALNLNDYKVVSEELSDLFFDSTITKPIILTEGKTDKKILETAWNKLYPDIELPYYIISPGINSLNDNDKTADAGSVQRALEYASAFTDLKIIGLFDNDREGRARFKGLNANIFEVYSDEIDIRKHQTKNIWGVCLPVPSFRRDFVSINSVTQRYFVIEHYFENSILENFNMKGENILTTNVFEISGNKNDFSISVNNLEKNDFLNFEILFQCINTLVA